MTGIHRRQGALFCPTENLGGGSFLNSLHTYSNWIPNRISCFTNKIGCNLDQKRTRPTSQFSISNDEETQQVFLLTVVNNTQRLMYMVRGDFELDLSSQLGQNIIKLTNLRLC